MKPLKMEGGKLIYYLDIKCEPFGNFYTSGPHYIPTMCDGLEFIEMSPDDSEML